ncbi:ferredoxin-type protein, NapH/MauN family [Acetonema longum DSM 6540]|uniref:Ferredoxin-type protein, NapH/MauN family n=2 Tax=Acetonema TaxID=2373 RepID=F7NMK3_9FIRM|nr:ferredoxin-type protein, NapH/MauN family [Acetonema longum DSM 6540]
MYCQSGGGNGESGAVGLRNLRLWRRVVQLTAAGLMTAPGWWPDNPVWLGTYISSRFCGIALTDPLAALEVAIAGKAVVWPLLWSAVPLILAAAVLGRIFCGWICPLNTAFEIAGSFRRKPQRALAGNWQPYWLLGGFLTASALIGLPVFTLISPIGILSRTIAFGAGFEAVFVVFLVCLELWYSRKAWCKKVCPVGALYGLLSRFRRCRISLDTARCTRCGACYAACGMGVDIGSPGKLAVMNCSNCGDCIAACPEHAVSYQWIKRRKGGAAKHEPFESHSR